ncbi:membrane steroid-binding protein 2-like [Zingiber officinale]|uniref:Cytochrome b5 heme-binding domain-containing protein n=1 Tax=Zingiber officinale TaxID=94328 RepID=A0A8J5FCB7_ZINOF|nr:membrane steroid-binding protein 2-like [Zingiber officinale]XP_042431176.1 membrane steroid-binding protein 2-like [Zingiber officinale]KAG6483533.1 hypothetical protein ZIOFF_060181 [Zingiber officinale]KAG6487446.1 hypothetical protein ZIOFF_056032 [Zingiber officinale]
MAFSSSLVAAIGAYTTLAPAAFFTILALMACVYHLVSAFFVYPDDEAAVKRSLAPPIPSTEEVLVPPPEPVQLGDISLEELRTYDGSDPKKPLLMAIKGVVYDVSIGRMLYGPGGPYAFFAGRETSRALALMSFDLGDLNSDLDDLGEAELEVLQDWEEKFKEKYIKVGKIVLERSKGGDEMESTQETKGGS